MVLSPLDLSSFNKYGYVVIKSAFSNETASLCRDEVWELMSKSDGVDRHDQATWVPKVSLDKVWVAEDGAPWENIFTDKWVLMYFL